jgi:hypothetical protein
VDGNTTLSEVETVESKDGLYNEGCLAHKDFMYSTSTKYAGLYLIFVWFWMSQFIVAMGQLVVSLTISLWYFNHRRLVNNATLPSFLPGCHLPFGNCGIWFACHSNSENH